MTDFTAFHFAEPRWLWLAAAAPVLLALLHRHAANARREQLARMASPHFVEHLTTSHSPARRRFKNILLLAAFALAGLALARPQWGNVQTDKTWLGEDVVFCLDCSLSMTTSDVLPSRLQRAKFSILDFVRRQSHGRVGLVAFAGSAFIQCPLTFDYDAFEETLLAVDEKTIPIPGTDIGRALNEAYRAMDKGSHRKTIVLVTDGEDLETVKVGDDLRIGSGIFSARHLATNGVVVFTIGVGTAAGKEIQTVNAAGQRELLRDAKGEIVRSRLDETTLREIAQATGGDYYPLGVLGDGLTRVRTAIHALDRASGLRQSAKNGVDRFHWFIAAMLALLVAESLVGTRRKALPAPALLIFPLLLFSPSAQASPETNFPTPVTARDFYNAGTRLLEAKKFAEAEQMFQSALAAQDGRVQPPALYNLGHTRFDEGAELLKKGPDAQKVSARGRAALAAGEQAIHEGESALAENNLDKMIAAYLEGRHLRHELRETQKTVQSAIEAYGAILTKWQRAADDFKSADELKNSDSNSANMNSQDKEALFNEKIVERQIAKLVDELRNMQEMMGSLGKQRQELGKLLGKLKGRIPASDAPPGAAGDEDDDDEGMQPDALAGQKENASREGDQMQIPLSPDQAGQILDGLSLDGSRRLPMSDQQGAPPKDRKGRNW